MGLPLITRTIDVGDSIVPSHDGEHEVHCAAVGTTAQMVAFCDACLRVL